MNDESVSFIACNTFPKLLQSPIGRRMPRNIEMKEPSRTDLHNDEDVDQLECRRHDNEEIAGDDGLGVITHKRHPSLLRVTRPLRISGISKEREISRRWDSVTVGGIM